VFQEHDKGRLRVEPWEATIVKQVVRAYRTDEEELEAELLKRLLELKLKHQSRARNWKSFLARSLYNAANNFVRERRARETRTRPLETEEEDQHGSSLDYTFAAPEEPIDLRVDLATLWEEIPPRLRDVWSLLLEEEGNASAVAKRLGRPRKTVEYWIHKLRRFIKDRGI
jgi:DNA-directed RNA polymerase specialized sigma24 family protein